MAGNSATVQAIR